MSEQITVTDGGVNAAKGFLAASTRAGIKPSATNRDMALIYSTEEAVLVGTFTRNLVKAAPVQRDSRIVQEVRKARAVIVNTGIANAVTGQPGLDACEKTAETAADLLHVKPEEVLTASTGVIGPQLPVEKICSGVKAMVPLLSDSREAAAAAADAIRTTDTKSKEISVCFEIGGKTCTIGAMCKGSGMIHPNMGTMLCFIMTDVKIGYDTAFQALRSCVDKTFNMISVDGDTSTNDTAILMANGLAGNPEIQPETPAYDIFCRALHKVTEFLAKAIAKDGEGATRLFTAHVTEAPDYDTARTLAKAIITSNLTKAAIFGKDANWGRIFCAMGYSGAVFDPGKTDITMKSSAGSILLVKNGMAVDFSEEKALEILSPDEVTAECCIHSGDAEATAWGCDLTYDYVKINGDYRS